MNDQEYYDAVCEVLRQLGWDKNPDFDTVLMDKYENKTPEESAQEFADEWED